MKISAIFIKNYKARLCEVSVNHTFRTYSPHIHVSCPLPNLFIFPQNFYWASLVAQLVKDLPAMQETPVQLMGQVDLLEQG